MKKIDWKKVWISFMNNVSLILLAIVLLWLVFTPFMRYNRDVTFTINVTGIDTNHTLSNSTIVSLGIECLKLCNGRFYDTQSKLELCYDQCTKVLDAGWNNG
jgi:hypothetical protein